MTFRCQPILLFATALCFSTSMHAADAPAPLGPVPLSHVTINDPFWSPKLDVWRTVTVNDCFDKFERDGALDNFDHVARGESRPRAVRNAPSKPGFRHPRDCKEVWQLPQKENGKKAPRSRVKRPARGCPAEPSERPMTEKFRKVSLTVNGKTTHPRIPCFSDARGTKRFGTKRVTVFTANQGTDLWHILYAWRDRGTLYSVSEHVAPPFTYKQVVANLDRLMRGLVRVVPAES